MSNHPAETVHLRSDYSGERTSEVAACGSTPPLNDSFGHPEDVTCVACLSVLAERELVLREFESLADFWTLSKGWVGEVALHDFRRKIAALRTFRGANDGE